MVQKFKKISVTEKVHEILKDDKKKFSLKSLSETILFYRKRK
jgi:hypothetical protein